MPIVRLDGEDLATRDAFHDTFARAFGFFDGYGKNFDAWIDCMSCLVDESTGMTSVQGTAGDPVVLYIESVDRMPRELFEQLVACAAFVNLQWVERGEPAILVVACNRSR